MRNSLQALVSSSVIGFALLCGGVTTAATPTAEEVSELVASDGADSDKLGSSASLDWDTLVVGADGDGDGDDDNGSSSGSAYVFTRSGGVWSE